MLAILRTLRASPRSVLVGALLGVLNLVLGGASLAGLAWGYLTGGFPAHAFQVAMSALLVSVGGIAVGIALATAKRVRTAGESL